MTTQRRAIGAYGERLAARHLQAIGLTVLQRNWRCSEGEIDLILRDGADLVFCEVKTRRTATFGPPAAAVDHRKVRRLRHLASRWLAETGVRAEHIRFDVMEVLPQRRGATRLVHIPGAF
ncbi:YraN family protein [Actinoplanes sp. NPDC023801]|uniref:YraN family protein n=1 Tax=Actinoplanes sp. NPDC023801 TaxID=3154595 RepID=UPI0034002840